MTVGFVGLGTMGSRMAANLLKAGHELIVHDASPKAQAQFAARGALEASSPREVAERCEVLFLSLPGPQQVEAVALGKDGLIEGLRPDSACFDLSTNSPKTILKLGEAFAARSAWLLDAPVSGGPKGAETGKLAIWVGGRKEIYERHKDLIGAIGDQVSYIGETGQATVAKLVHNCAGYAINTVLAEVFTMGVKAGVDPLVLFKAIRSGAQGRRRTFDGLVSQFLPGVYDPPAFALELAHKDVTLATETGRENGVPMRLCNLALAEMTEALNRGWGGRDSRSIMLLQQERAGVQIAVPVEDIRKALLEDQSTLESYAERLPKQASPA